MEHSCSQWLLAPPGPEDAQSQTPCADASFTAGETFPFYTCVYLNSLESPPTGTAQLQSLPASTHQLSLVKSVLPLFNLPLAFCKENEGKCDLVCILKVSSPDLLY